MFTNIKKIISIGLLCIVPSQLYPMLVKTANRRPNLPHYQLKSRAHPQSRERQRNTTLRVPSKLVPLKRMRYHRNLIQVLQIYHAWGIIYRLQG